MNKFTYEKKLHEIEAYGKTYEIPTKTVELIDKLNEINTKITTAKATLDVIKATKEGIAVFIGPDEADRIFPDERLTMVDTDELSALWLFLKAESNKATAELMQKYAPNPIIRK